MAENNLRLECDGFTSGLFDVPRFRVCAGEIVHICFDENSYEGSIAGDEVMAVLSQQQRTKYVRSPQGVVGALLATSRRGIQEWFHRQTISQWLQANAHMSPNEADAVLKAAELDPIWPVSQVAGSPRTLLGVLAALATSSQTVIVQTTGWCDPLGVRTVLRALFDRLGDKGAVYISSPVDWKWPEFEFAATLPVTRSATFANNRAAG